MRTAVGDEKLNYMRFYLHIEKNKLQSHRSSDPIVLSEQSSERKATRDRVSNKVVRMMINQNHKLKISLIDRCF